MADFFNREAWIKIFSHLKNKSLLTMFLLGFSAGLPLLLVFTTLSAWLRDEDIVRSTIGFFGWITIFYGLKFLWAPLIDTIKLPMLHNLLGKRRSWLLLTQISIAGFLYLLATVSPTGDSLLTFAVCALFVSFFSASQEEQQEILLSFWQKYRYLLIASLLVIASAIIGRDYLQTSSFEEDLNSATEYQEYIEAETDQKALGEKILQSYPESIYSDFVRLNEAKRNYNDGDFNAAIDLLIYILDSKSMSPDEFDPIIAAAQTRLAKIYIEQQNFNEVISIFESKSEMTSSMHELKGDAHNGLGQFSLARESFMLALQNSTNQTARALINMKISDLESEEVE